METKGLIMQLFEQFKEKASKVNCIFFECKSIEEALPYLVKIAKSKAPCEILDDTNIDKFGELSTNNVPTRLIPLIAAPDLTEEEFISLKKVCEANNIDCIQNQLRQHLAGIDIGISKARLGVAETGSCLIDTTDDDIRLATMISEIHVIILEKSAIKPSLISVAEDLRNMMNARKTSNSLFVTGPSRTSDIERIAAVGVHGPLEVHIILLDL